MCKSIFDINIVYFVIINSSKYKRKALYKLIHTTGISGSDCMECRGSVLGPITAVQMMLPMWTKDNCLTRILTRSSIHPQLSHLVQLRNFTLFPVGLGTQLLEFTTSETTNIMLSSSCVGGFYYIHSKRHGFGGKISRSKGSIRIIMIQTYHAIITGNKNIIIIIIIICTHALIFFSFEPRRMQSSNMTNVFNRKVRRKSSVEGES